jgi:hypothetical protein
VGQDPAPDRATRPTMIGLSAMIGGSVAGL